MHIVRSLLNGREKELENGLALLCELVKIGKAFKFLIQYGGLQELTRWMLCNNKKIRLKCAEICHLLYRDSKPVQNAFLSVDGHTKLVQILSWSSKSEAEVEMVLQFIEDLVIYQKKKIRKNVCELLNQAMLKDVLDQIQLTSIHVTMRIKLLRLKLSQQYFSN